MEIVTETDGNVKTFRSLLVAHMGSEVAAEEERRRIQQRQRWDEIRGRALAERNSTQTKRSELARRARCLEGELRRMRASLRRLRAGIPEIVQVEVRRVAAEELPPAIAYLNTRVQREARNGQA